MSNPYLLIERAKIAADRAVQRRGVEKAFLALELRQVVALERIADALTVLAEHNDAAPWGLPPAVDDPKLWAE